VERGARPSRQLTRQLLADSRRPAFALALAFAGRGPALAGFAYGLRRWPYPAAGDDHAFPRTEPFELCELAVRPAAQGRGAGRALHDAILAASGPQPRWLVTHPAAHPAVRLYRASGWHTRRVYPSRADGTPRVFMTRPS
jgi:ribosomal protein S18 acetylase RimI-like enzyme